MLLKKTQSKAVCGGLKTRHALGNGHKFKAADIKRKCMTFPAFLIFALGLSLQILSKSEQWMPVGQDGFRKEESKKRFMNTYALSNNSEVHRDTCVLTISAWNNFGFVSSLYDSIMMNSPRINCFIWFVGDNSDPRKEEDNATIEEVKKAISNMDKFMMVTMKEMDDALDNFESMKISFKFNLVELQTTMKPFAFQYAFQEIRVNSAIYLDNDIWVTDSLEDIQEELNHRSCVLTPHCSTPLPEDRLKQRDIHILSSGVFNFGFVAFSNTNSTTNFLQWWSERLNVYGFNSIDNSMFYDQIWGHFVPAFFDHDDYIVIRDFRYNIAYWNLHERGENLHMKGGFPHIKNPDTDEDERVVFMHFSGTSLLEEYDIEQISRHQTRFSLYDFPRLKSVFESYIDFVLSHDTLRFRNITYGFNEFSDGSIVEPWMREIYAAAIYPVSLSSFQIEENSAYDISYSPFIRTWFRENVFHNPFCCSEECKNGSSKISFQDWLLSGSPTDVAVNMEGNFYFSVLQEHLWKKRKDLQAAFPDPYGLNYKAFKGWFHLHSVPEKFIDKKLYRKWSRKVKSHRQNRFKIHRRIGDNETNIGLNIIGWHSGQFSIGISSLKLVKAAKTTNLPINAIHSVMVEKKTFIHPNRLPFNLTRSCSEPINLVVINPLDFEWAVASDYPGVIWSQKYNIGYWAWEIDTFPQESMSILQHFDEVWCPSHFIKESIQNSRGYDQTQIRVLPLPLDDSGQISDTAVLTDLIPRQLSNTSKQKPFVFMVVFDYHSVVERKNPAAAIRAFLEAFPTDDDKSEFYQLIIKTHSGTETEIQRLEEMTGDDSRIVIINDLLSETGNHALHIYQDCHISLHRSEGYGMNILETMGHGIPVIATNYSGNVEFSTVFTDSPECYFPIPYKLVELDEDQGPYLKGNHWADPDHKSVVDAMRSVAGNDCRNRYGDKISRKVKELYGLEAIGKKMNDMLVESLPAIRKVQGRKDIGKYNRREKRRKKESISVRKAKESLKEQGKNVHDEEVLSSETENGIETKQ